MRYLTEKNPLFPVPHLPNDLTTSPHPSPFPPLHPRLQSHTRIHTHLFCTYHVNITSRYATFKPNNVKPLSRNEQVIKFRSKMKRTA
jgi:hypothetical protein